MDGLLPLSSRMWLLTAVCEQTGDASLVTLLQDFQVGLPTGFVIGVYSDLRPPSLSTVGDFQFPLLT